MVLLKSNIQQNFSLLFILDMVVFCVDGFWNSNFLDLFSRNINYINNRQYDFAFSQQKSEVEQYDFIIIGAGSSGSVIANRLSENPDWNILLIEAGKRENFISQIPLLAPTLQLTPYNWGYTMEKQEGMCNGMEENQCSWPRGRALGGTSVINYMIYTRGSPLDFEEWQAQGNPGWSYEDVLPYFLKSERCNLGEECFSKYHNNNGYLNVEFPYTTKLSSAFIKAGEEMGYRNVDYNTQDQIGFSRLQATLQRGVRQSVSSAFLEPFEGRPNLEIVTSARVTKILINPDSKEAYGVEYYKNNVKFTMHSKKEVILCAGSFHSPQLLMLSGVGPKDHLKDLGIPLVTNLPVGQTLYDHVAFLPTIFTINETIISSSDTLKPLSLLSWLSSGKGILSSLGGVEAIAFIKTNVTERTEDTPNIELLLVTIGSLQFDHGLFSRPQLRVTNDIYDEFFKPLEKQPCFAILPVLLHPKSKGFLKLKSADPFDPPLLFGNYFSDRKNEDMETMMSGIRFVEELTNTLPFQKLNARIYSKPIPGCENHTFDTDEYWECAIRSLSISLHHQISTCRMGPVTDNEAVVDNKLRVYGIKNLRVADSSVIPVTLSAHTNAPSIMIGEKLSDILKDDWSS